MTYTEHTKSNHECSDITLIGLSPSPIVVIASANASIRSQMSRLLLEDSLNVILVSGLEEFKIVLEYENVVACICGFHLSNGVTRDVVTQAHEQPIEIPVVIASAPANPNEYEEFLASLNMGAFDFICHPYRPTEVRNIMWSAIKFHGELARLQTTQYRNPRTHLSQFESQLANLADPPQRAAQSESKAHGEAHIPQLRPFLTFPR